jgi:hypothetical protein
MKPEAWFKWSCLLITTTQPGCWDVGDSSDAGTTKNNGGADDCLAEFSACGGDVTGTWKVKSTCPMGNPADTVNANFAAYADCGGACTAASLTVTGQKTYDTGVLTSGESFRLLESLSMIDTCFAEATGTSLTDSTCATAANEFASATCAQSGAVCNCQVNETLNNTATSYSLAGNSLTEVGASSLIGPTVEYCVTGETMRQRRTLPPGAIYGINYVRQ